MQTSTAYSSLQVCMDSSDWLQGTMSEEISTGLDSSSSPSDCMLAAACSSRSSGPPLMAERRLRPPHDQNLKCPRCDSTHTKFCYYNNYSLSQPRYFCKTCRRYWTKGGTLRNIPVGGGCRKNNKKSKKSNDQTQPVMNHGSTIGSTSSNPTYDHQLHLSFPHHHELQFSPHLANLMSPRGSNFNFMESKYEFMGSNNGSEFGNVGGIDHYNGICSSSPFGVCSNDHIHDGNSTFSFMDQRLMLPYDGNDNHHHHHHRSGLMDVKPNPKLLSLEWKDQGCTSDDAIVKEYSSFGYNNVNGTLTSWSTGMMGGNFQPSTTNSLL